MKIIRENRFLIIFSMFVISITSISYWLGFNMNDDLYEFSGFIIGVGDGNSYLAKMMLGASGEWLFTTPYTAYPQMKFFAFFPYILLGKLTANPGQTIQLIVLFHLFRWVGIVFLIFETFRLSSIFVKDKNTSLLITALLILGGGLGWLAIIFPGLVNHRMPLEFYSPETFGYLSVFSLPHLLFGRAFLYNSFRKLLQIGDNLKFSKKPLLKSGISLFFSGIFQPINLFIGWFVMGGYFLARSIRNKFFVKNVKNYFFWIIPSIPLFFYNFFSFLFDPYLSTWQDQNRIISPPFVDYLFAYGLGVIILFLVYKKGLSQKINHRWFINIWILLIPVLIYFPINIQRRLTEGVWFCFCIYIGIYVMANKNTILKILVMLVFLLSNILFTLGSLQTIQNVDVPIYTPIAIIEVGNFLHNEVEKGDVVIAPFDESNLLPVYAPVKVITGHGPESKNLSEITEKLDLFYQGELSQTQTQEFFKPFNIKFIVVPKDLNSTMILSQFTANQITQTYENNDYMVLKVND